MNCIITLKLKEILSGARLGPTQIPFGGGYVNPAQTFTFAEFSGRVIDEKTGEPPLFDNGSIESAKIWVSPVTQNSGLNTVHANECEGIIDGFHGNFSVDSTFFVRLLGIGSTDTIQLRVSLDAVSLTSNSGAQMITTYSFSISQ